MNLSKLQRIMMAQISQEQLTGYDLKKQLMQHGWRASHQQIYRDLAKLEKIGLVTLEIVPQTGKPDKKLYLLTVAGRGELSKAYEITPCLVRTQDETLVQLFMANTQYFEQLATLLDEALVELENQPVKDDLLQKLAVERDIKRLEAEFNWVNQVVNALELNVGTKAA